MKFAGCLTAVLSLFLSLSPAFAQEPAACPEEVAAAVHLPEVRDAALAVLNARCGDPSKTRMMLAYNDFLNQVSGWFDPYGGFAGDERPVEHIKEIVNQGSADSVAVGLSANDTLVIGEREFMPASEGDCERVARTACGAVTDEFIRYYTLAQNAYASLAVAVVIQEISALRQQWEPFLDTMRGQTALELAVNGWVYKNRETADFSAPPSKQWILLHPVLLVENVNAAIDGQNTQEAIGVELLGLNWWQQDSWYVPSGGSVLAVYSDRQDVNDWGYGVALHFKSVYTIGYTHRSGDDGVFVSLDLLKLFQNKNAAFKAYIEESGL
ncbi:MAG: hypothetical protein AAFX56_08110 [Pseudomonadota bacterium]